MKKQAKPAEPPTPTWEVEHLRIVAENAELKAQLAQVAADNARSSYRESETILRLRNEKAELAQGRRLLQEQVTAYRDQPLMALADQLGIKPQIGYLLTDAFILAVILNWKTQRDEVLRDCRALEMKLENQMRRYSELAAAMSKTGGAQ